MQNFEKVRPTPKRPTHQPSLQNIGFLKWKHRCFGFKTPMFRTTEQRALYPKTIRNQEKKIHKCKINRLYSTLINANRL